MGLFSFIKSAATEANNEVHGKRLLAGVHETLAEIESLNSRLQYVAMAGYVEIRGRLQEDMSNFTREGMIQLGRKMQEQARQTHAVDRANSYAKWLAGAWLESFGRCMQSAQSREALVLLNKFEMHIKKEILEMTGRDKDSACYQDLDILDFDDWLLAFKRIAARYNSSLSLNENDGSFIDFMDLRPLREAFDDGLLPEDIAPDFAKQFDMSAFGLK